MMVIINAPPSFALAWRVLRGWMDPQVRTRAHILSEKSPELAIEYLKKLIEPSQLPADFGGDAPPLRSWPERGGLRGKAKLEADETEGTAANVR